MTLRARILALAFVGAIGVIVVGGVGYFGLVKATAATSRQAATNTTQHAQADAELTVGVIRASVSDAVIAAHARDVTRRDQAVTTLKASGALLREQMDKIAASSQTEALKAHQRELAPQLESYLTAGIAIAENASADSAGVVAVAAELPAFASQFQAIASGIEKSRTLVDNDAISAAAASASQYSMAKTIVLAIAFPVVAITLLVGFALGRHLTSSLRLVAERASQLSGSCINQLNVAIKGLAAGDLTPVITPSTQLLEITTSDEIAALCHPVNDLITQSKATITSFEEARANLRGVIAGTNRLASEAREGRLNERGKESDFAGSYRELVQSINSTLEAVVAPMKETSEVLERVAGKDLTARVRGQYRGEHARIASALNSAIEQLAGALGEVSETIVGVATSASQIEAGNKSLAAGASDQAGSLQEVSSSARELAAMTKQNAASAAEGRSLSEAARSSTKDGVTEVQRLADAIARIKASSEATAKIIRTIDEIAFQTNLLALNAAVEAARAGDSGRGFAVVAEEVRNLAMRSAEAAKNTAALIEESVKSTDLGVTINSHVLTRLSEIDDRVNRVGQVVAEIAVASDEQAKGVELIDRALEEMSQRTQQVAATADQSEAASRALSEQSSTLQDLVGEFQLDSTAGRGKPTPAFSGKAVPAIGAGRRPDVRPKGAPSRAETRGRTPAKAVARIASSPAPKPAARPERPAAPKPLPPPQAKPSPSQRSVKDQGEISIPLDDDDWNTIQSF